MIIFKYAEIILNLYILYYQKNNGTLSRKSANRKK